jgi:hypothetical protein
VSVEGVAASHFHWLFHYRLQPTSSGIIITHTAIALEACKN